MLFRVEADPQFDGFHYVCFDAADFPDHSVEEITYHVELLFEAGFLKGDGGTLDALTPAISRLTWQGHEFIADTRDPGVWEQVKERARGLPDVAVSAIWEIAKAEVRKRLGL